MLDAVGVGDGAAAAEDVEPLGARARVGGVPAAGGARPRAARDGSVERTFDEGAGVIVGVADVHVGSRTLELELVEREVRQWGGAEGGAVVERGGRGGGDGGAGDLRGTVGDEEGG